MYVTHVLEGQNNVNPEYVRAQKDNDKKNEMVQMFGRFPFLSEE